MFAAPVIWLVFILFAVAGISALLVSACVKRKTYKWILIMGGMFLISLPFLLIWLSKMEGAKAGSKYTGTYSAASRYGTDNISIFADGSFIIETDCLEKQKRGKWVYSFDEVEMLTLTASNSAFEAQARILEDGAAIRPNIHVGCSREIRMFKKQ